MLFFGRKYVPDNGDKSPNFAELQHDLSVTRSISLAGVGIGLGLIYLLKPHPLEMKEVFDLFFWALACYVSGALTGFLFGIPRVIQKLPDLGSSKSKGSSEAPNTRSAYELIINTNLDDVSDWLTKIIVGLSLTQIAKIPSAIHSLAEFAAGESHQELVPSMVAIIIYFAVVGFVGGYLTTRMFFQRAFRIADLAASESYDRQVVERQTPKVTTELISPPLPT